jgi:DNA-binding MarR family transcriptional regulator
MTHARPGGSPPSSDPSLFDLLEDSLTTSDRANTAGILRALARPLASALARMRQEAIAPFEDQLQFFARRLSREAAKEGTGETSAAYLLGRVHALLDLCAVGIDRSLSEAVLQQARRAHARTILSLVAERNMTVSELLASNELRNLSQPHLSNILRWMEAAELIRRVESGRNVLVALGPKGAAVLDALGPSAEALPAATPGPGGDPDARNVDVVSQFLERYGDDAAAASEALSLVLLASFGGQSAPLRLGGDGPMSARWRRLFERLDALHRQTLKRAVVRAIAAWSPAVHSPGVLEQLALLTSALRFTESALPLAEAFGRLRATMSSDAQVRTLPTVEAIIQALSALGPDPEVEIACLRLLDGPRLDARLLGRLLVALVRSSPAEFAAHLERFRQVVVDTEFLEPHTLVDSLLQAVPLEIVMREVPRLNAETFDLICDGLFAGPQPHVRIAVDRGSVRLEDAEGRWVPVQYEGEARARMNIKFRVYAVDRSLTPWGDLVDDFLRGIRSDWSPATTDTFELPRPTEVG